MGPKLNRDLLINKQFEKITRVCWTFDGTQNKPCFAHQSAVWWNKQSECIIQWVPNLTVFRWSISSLIVRMLWTFVHQWSMVIKVHDGKTIIHVCLLFGCPQVLWVQSVPSPTQIQETWVHKHLIFYQGAKTLVSVWKLVHRVHSVKCLTNSVQSNHHYLKSNNRK